MKQEIVHRYMRLLGINAQPKGLGDLRSLVRSHLRAVPFENISKLLASAHVTTLEEFLDGIELSDLGGTCYTNNPFLAELLRELGYDTDLHGADMSKPNVHTCIRVRIDGVAYHVDVGFAAPFREPMRLDALPFEIEEGENRYVLSEQDEGRYRMQMGSGFGYVVHDPPRTRDFFDPIVLGSYALTSEFMTSIRISRVFDWGSLDLINRKLYRHEAGKTVVTPLDSLEDMKAAVQDQLQMPRCPIEQAIAVVEQRSGKPFFS